MSGRMGAANLAAGLLLVLVLLPGGGGASVPLPSYVPGDHWGYEVTGSYGVKGTLLIQVTGTDTMRYLGKDIPVYIEKVNRSGANTPGPGTVILTRDLGTIREEYPGMVVSYEPPYRELRFPMEAGDTWTSRVNRSARTGNATVNDTITLDVEVGAPDEVAVPAGTFTAFLVKIREKGTSSEFRVWYSGEVGGAVKREFILSGSVSERWVLTGFAYARGAEAAAQDYTALVLVVAGVAVPVLVLVSVRERFVGIIRSDLRRWSRRATRKRWGATKVYNRKSDKGRDDR